MIRAEDLHVAPVITWWNNNSVWADGTLLAQPLVQFDRTRYYHLLEIIRNGQVERKVPIAEVLKTGSLGSIQLDSSGWFLVRAIANVAETFRFASTAPYYMEIGRHARRISKPHFSFMLHVLQHGPERRWFG